MAAIYLVVSPLIVKSNLSTISFVDANAQCPVAIGQRINQIEGTPISTAESFENAIRDKKAGQTLTMVVEGRPTRCTMLSDGYLGVRMENVETESNLKFGIEVEGGARVLLQAEGNPTRDDIEKSIGILTNRINFYGLSDVQIAPLGQNVVQIEMAGVTGDDIRNLLARQGKFDGKVEEIISLPNGTGTMIFNGRQIPVKVSGNQVTVGNSSYSVNQTFTIENVNFQVFNFTNNSATIHAGVFTGEDIVAVLTDPQNSIVRPVEGGHEFQFTIQITPESADRFAKITRGQPSVFRGGQSYIEPRLVLFLDEQRVSELNVASGLAGQTITTVSIQGVQPTREEAVQERLRLETILRSGSLPVKFEIVKMDTITQTAGKELINSIIYVTIAIAIAVSAIIFIRYRDIKIALPMVVLSLSEFLLLLGVAASQIFAVFVIVLALAIGILKKEILGMIGWITVIVMIFVTVTVVIGQWTLDIAAIAGLIAIMGTSLGQMIIMTDQLLKESDKSLRERHKFAMGLIWNSAATVVFAMLPLIVIGVGSLRGFAIATIVGIFIGLLITRPAYMAVLEKIKKLNLESG